MFLYLLLLNEGMLINSYKEWNAFVISHLFNGSQFNGTKFNGTQFNGTQPVLFKQLYKYSLHGRPL